MSKKIKVEDRVRPFYKSKDDESYYVWIKNQLKLIDRPITESKKISGDRKMSKFKTGDKVLIKCSENNTLLEEVFVEDKILFEITSVYYNDTKKMWAYKIRDLKNIFVFDYVEDELELYKTPHQELLDLGWELSKVDNRYIEYIDEEDNYLIIDKIEKTYYNLSSYYRPFDINLQLARILVRYLEENEK